MIKRIKTSIYARSPRLTKKKLAGKGFIFMLHRILPQKEREEFTWNRGLAISPEKLEEWVLFFKSKNFDIVSIDEALKRCEIIGSRKFVVITMDDGYKDNLTLGLPLFEKLNIPVTIYISTCFPNNTTIYWWYFLEEFLQENDHIDLTPIGLCLKFECISSEQKSIAFKGIREKLRQADYQTHVRFAAEICGIKNLNDVNTKLNLTWEEVRLLSKSPLITIGAHTVHHVSLSNQTAETAEIEIFSSKKEIEAQTNLDVYHFAYPYGSLGDASKREFSLLKKAGFKSGVFNHPGSIFSVKGDGKYTLPRMGLSDETLKSKMLDLFEGKVHLNFNGVNKTIC